MQQYSQQSCALNYEPSQGGSNLTHLICLARLLKRQPRFRVEQRQQVSDVPICRYFLLLFVRQFPTISELGQTYNSLLLVIWNMQCQGPLRDRRRHGCALWRQNVTKDFGKTERIGCMHNYCPSTSIAVVKRRTSFYSNRQHGGKLVLARCPVKPSTSAIRSTSAAIARSPSAEYSITLLDRKN